MPAHGGQAVAALAAIPGVGGHTKATGGGEWEPSCTSRQARTTVASGSGAVGAWMDRRVPSARHSSSGVVAVGWGQEGADGTATKPRGLRGAAGGGAICFCRSVRRPRTCVATREGGQAEASATACSQRAWGKRSPGCGRVWRQGANCPAHWSRWCAACKGGSICMIASMSSGSFHEDDCRTRTIEIHAGWSEAHCLLTYHVQAPAVTRLPTPDSCQQAMLDALGPYNPSVIEKV